MSMARMILRWSFVMDFQFNHSGCQMPRGIGEVARR